MYTTMPTALLVGSLVLIVVVLLISPRRNETFCGDVYTARILDCLGMKGQTGCRTEPSRLEQGKEAFSSGTMMQMESNRGSRTDAYMTGLNNPHTVGYEDAKLLQKDDGYRLEEGDVSVADLPIDLIGWHPNVTDDRRYHCSRCR